MTDKEVIVSGDAGLHKGERMLESRLGLPKRIRRILGSIAGWRGGKELGPFN